MLQLKKWLSLLLFAVLLCVFATPVAADDPTNQEQAQDQPTSPEASDTEAEQLRSEEELLEKAASITEQVVEIRGLPVKEAIPKGVQNRDELRQMLVSHFEEEIPREEFEAEARVFRLMGLFDEDFDYRELMLDLYTEQIAGFYDQDRGELYIMKGLPEPLQKLTMAHEIFHAIQDQHFDIGAMLEPFSSRENRDFFLARMALIEGDATVLMFDYELYERGTLPQNRIRSFIDVPMMAAFLLELDLSDYSAVEQMESADAIDIVSDPVPSLTDSVLDGAPPIVRDTLLFPYVEGMRFVIQARAGRTWSEFDQIYDDPPVSTAQILHPELYFDGVYPHDLSFDAAAALPGYEMLYETVFGELHIRSWMETILADASYPPDAAEVAQGWLGDRLRAYEGPDDNLVVVHLSSWQTEDDARLFAEAVDQGLSARHDVSSTHRSGEYGESWCLRIDTESQSRRASVERWGTMVLYIEGAPSTLNDQGAETDPSMYLIRQAVWDSHERVPFEEVLRARSAELATDSDRPAADSQTPENTSDQ